MLLTYVHTAHTRTTHKELINLKNHHLSEKPPKTVLHVYSDAIIRLNDESIEIRRNIRANLRTVYRPLCVFVRYNSLQGLSYMSYAHA